MKILCNYCKEQTDVQIKDVNIEKHTNIFNEDCYILCVYYNTFCKRCGEFISGVKRKEIKIDEVLRLCQ